MIVPYKTDLPLTGTPYISISIVILCVLVYLLQSYNYEQIIDSVDQYCDSIYVSDIGPDTTDILRTDKESCSLILETIYQYDQSLWEDVFREELLEKFEYSKQKVDAAFKILSEHETAYSIDAPVNIDGYFSHYPNSINPFPMVLSALAHADFEHLFFNLLFFFAFAPALELLIDNKKKFLITLIGISFLCSIGYALSVVITFGTPYPSVGLSGVVMGVIGLAGFLIPRAHIGFIFWFFVIIKKMFFPAWLVACWYVGWDIVDMMMDDGSSSINFIAHIVGGIGGYVIGMRYFAKEKEQLKCDVEEMTFEAKLDRNHSPGSSLYSGGRRDRRIRNELNNQTKEYNQHIDCVYQHVRHGQDSEALIILMDDIELYRADIKILEYMFERVMTWGPSRSGLCLGRLLIHLLCQRQKYAWAHRITEECIKIAPEFIFANQDDEKMMQHYIEKEHNKVR